MLNSTRSAAKRRRGSRELPADTRSRILDTAERLFSERGVDGVSVRAVLKEAGVNAALANYHFGSREGLIEELLRTRVAPLAEEQIRAIDEVDARGGAGTLEDVLRAYVAPATRAAAQRPHFGKLFAQLQFSANPAIREMGRDAMRKTLYRLGDALMKRIAPSAEPERLLLRLFLVFLAPAQLASQWDVVLQSARKRFPDRLPTAELAAEELIAFCAAGLRAGAAPGKEP
jgi:AcrR family transcriptional regulator